MTFQAIHNIATLLLALSVGCRLSQVRRRMRAHEAVTLANAKALLAISEAMVPKPISIAEDAASGVLEDKDNSDGNDDYH